MFILKVYIYFPYINKQRQATVPFDNNTIISPQQSEHWTMGLCQGLDDPCEVDRDFDLNRLASAITDNELL